MHAADSNSATYSGLSETSLMLAAKGMVLTGDRSLAWNILLTGDEIDEFDKVDKVDLAPCNGHRTLAVCRHHQTLP
jgi:hypothetical protein